MIHISDFSPTLFSENRRENDVKDEQGKNFGENERRKQAHT